MGGLYLTSGPTTTGCDRLPLRITPCEVCGQEPRFNRSISRISPFALWGNHYAEVVCSCEFTVIPRHCPVCNPTDVGYLMWVGSEYTIKSFSNEALAMGVSKRIPALPVGFVLGQSVLYLAYLKALPASGQLPLLALDSPTHRSKHVPAVFMSCVPSRLELIVTDVQAADEVFMAGVRAKGITPVVVPHNDVDHKR